MKLVKKALFSVVEVAFMFLLIIFSLGFIYNPSVSNSFDQDNSYAIISLLDIINRNDLIVETVFQEDLTLTPIQENWSELETILNSQVENYYLSLYDGSNYKIIFDCNVNFKIEKNQILLMGDSSNNLFSYRVLTLGVCS